MRRTAKIIDTDRQDQQTPDVYKAICQDAAEGTNANLVSLWVFDKDLTSITCNCHYDAIEESFSSGAVLLKQNYPAYFNTIVKEGIISATDVTKNIATKELVKGYFKPLDIYSMLDFTLYRDNKPIGIICCENRGEIRDWSNADVKYLRTLSTLTAHHFTQINKTQ